MSLKPIRDEIDAIDRQITELFCRRMECSKQVAQYKIENGIPVLNTERENQVLDEAAESAGEYGSSARLLYATIMELSRAVQHDMMGSGSKLKNEIFSAEKDIPFKSENIRIACFGASGAYAHKAAVKLFPNAEIKFFSPFRNVFQAIQNGEADFGIVPIENSSAGSVTAVYDLMLQYRFHIAAAVDLPVDHCLAAKKGVSADKIGKVYSHQQALSQCSDYLNAHPSIKIREFVSTAQAAEKVSLDDDMTAAAICSEEAAAQYCLDILLRGFQNNPNNTTRFIVISKNIYIADNADKISLCFALPHVTGSLYSILCRFAAHGLNLTKIESRPIFGRAFEYMFYLDFTGTTAEKNTVSLLCALSDELTDFSFLGNYPEK